MADGFPNKVHIRQCMLYEFKCKSNAIVTTENIRATYGKKRLDSSDDTADLLDSDSVTICLRVSRSPEMSLVIGKQLKICHRHSVVVGKLDRDTSNKSGRATDALFESHMNWPNHKKPKEWLFTIHCWSDTRTISQENCYRWWEMGSVWQSQTCRTMVIKDKTAVT